MDKIKQEVINWKVNELEPLVSAIVKREMQNTTKWNADKKATGRSYSESVGRKEKGEAVLIIKPINEEEKSSELTKNDIKNKIEISKLGVGITKMKRVTKGAVVVGCENKVQADKLKEKVEQDLGNKYIIQEPRKKKQRIKIFDVDQEDILEEKDFWRKVEEQNEFKR
ncbi:hypothetical protein RF55_20518, partial [Lasius niger]